MPVATNNGEATAKVSTLEGLYALLARSFDGHRLLWGDFNAPRVEYPDGRVLTWAQNEPRGIVIKKRGERWDAAERSVLLGLADYDLTDAYRKIHGYADQAESWAAINRGNRFPRRLDHLLASASLGVREVRYRNDWQYANLSDHAAVEAVLDPTPLH